MQKNVKVTVKKAIRSSLKLEAAKDAHNHAVRKMAEKEIEKSKERIRKREQEERERKRREIREIEEKWSVISNSKNGKLKEKLKDISKQSVNSSVQLLLKEVSELKNENKTLTKALREERARTSELFSATASRLRLLFVDEDIPSALHQRLERCSKDVESRRRLDDLLSLLRDLISVRLGPNQKKQNKGR